VTLSQNQPISTLEELRAHLQYAIGVELTTIPAYLCALYSIEEGENTAAVETIQSVVLEEMLHMALAANTLNAIGGVPSTGPVAGGGPSPIPTYPTKVPFIKRIPEIHLERFSPQALDLFIAIELPGGQGSDASASNGGDQYDSIGTFYEAIEQGLRDLATDDVFAKAARERAGCQLTAEHYYGGAGRLIEVTDLKSALAAISEIVTEGEGAPEHVLGETIDQHVTAEKTALEMTGIPESYSVDDKDRLPFGWKMYSHYARFKEIRAGRRYFPDQLVGDTPRGDILPVDWSAVLPMGQDPKAKVVQGTPAHALMSSCNETYTRLVDMLYASFNGAPETLAAAVHVMYELKYQATALMHVPSPADPTVNLGPEFQYLPGSGPP
jgi:hypothetical protein